MQHVKPVVLFKAPVLTQSGYGVHARQVARALLELADKGEIDLYIEPVRWGNTPWLLASDGLDGLIGRIRRYVRPQETSAGRVKFTATVQLVLPNEWTPIPGAVNIGLTAAVESDRMNPLWLPAVNSMDLVIVPSKHIEGVIRSAGDVTTQLIVVPESYPQVFNDSPVSISCQSAIADALDKLDTKFNFLVVGQMTSSTPQLDRKNILGTVKTICDAFRSDSDVGIVLKTNSGRGTLIDRKNTTDRLTVFLRDVRRGPTPRVHLIHGDISERDVATLYTHPSIKAFVSLTRGEGFGLPILEAAASKLPVIATDWGGHLDFMNMGRFIKVKYALHAVPDAKVDRAEDPKANIWIAGSRWAQPDESNAITALKRFRTSPDIPKMWAEELSREVRYNNGPGVITAVYVKLFEQWIMGHARNSDGSAVAK